jgi:hypothetical protein
VKGTESAYRGEAVCDYDVWQWHSGVAVMPEETCQHDLGQHCRGQR